MTDEIELRGSNSLAMVDKMLRFVMTGDEDKLSVNWNVSAVGFQHSPST